MPTEQCNDKKLEEFLAEYRRRGCTPADLPDAVRRQLFWIIKRHTSYTAWARAFVAFDALIRKMESLLPELAAKPFGTYGLGLPPDTKPFTVWPDWEHKLKLHRDYRAALARLRKGDKRALGTVPPEPVLGWQDWPCEALLCFFRGMHPRDGYGRNFDPVIPEKAALIRLAKLAWCLAAENTELSRIPDAHDFDSMDCTIPYSPEDHCLKIFLPFHPDKKPDDLSRYPIPANLPPVPDPVILPGRKAPLTLSSKEMVPLPGIYLSAPYDDIRYLPTNATAPFLSACYDYTQEKVQPCTWTLIWRDDRYENGADIPEEEALYFPED